MAIAPRATSVITTMWRSDKRAATDLVGASFSTLLRHVFLPGTTGARTRMPSRAADFRTTPVFAGAARERRAWSGLCLDRMLVSRRPRPSSLYTFTSSSPPDSPAASSNALGSASSCSRSHQRTSAKSSPTLSASRSSFPADRLTDSSLLCLPIPPSSHAAALDFARARSSFGHAGKGASDGVDTTTGAELRPGETPKSAPSIRHAEPRAARSFGTRASADSPPADRRD